MDLTAALRAFVRIVERSSMTEAAHDLGVSQPAISKQMTGLEARVRARLLERSPRHVRPTAAGQALYEATRSGLAAIDAALEGVSRGAGEVEGGLRIHAQCCIGAKIVHPLVMDFQRDHPAVSVDLILENRVIDLVYDNFDMAIRYGRPEAQDVVVRRLGSVDRLLVASPAFLDAFGPIDTPERLASLRLVTTSNVLSQRRVLTLLREGAAIEVPVRPAIHTNDAEVLVRTLLAGHACGPVQRLLVAEDLEAGRLVRILPDHEVRPAEMVLAYPSVRYMRPVVRSFADALVRHLAGTEGIA
ncbi:LysR family transcriptional regulator [Aurantimonas sp. Leaf443]|uniref:LysR family transcriptional regulator n=1 Tax=Aurantimonas sp. Leaf443 TaxID=1736378 RepID=UPI0007001A8D|nr:LysR family transcriptional regulator [Aurantimonas sp. Leaf443]KQT85577.1 LysR family transcriptional regulator [Aurantimonas sp. Leaf443]